MRLINYLKTSILAKAFLFFIGVVLIIRLIGGLTNFPDKVFPKINQFFSTLLFSISSKFSFSIGDVFYTVLAIVGILFLIQIIRFLYMKKYEKIKIYVARLIYFSAGFFFVFNIVWGFNYYKIPIKESYNVELDSVEELKRMAEFYYEKAVQLREQVPENERGVFAMSLSEEELKKELYSVSIALSQKYPELKFINQNPANLKSSLFSTTFSYLGVLGYYNPFTAEAQYNSNMPDSKLVFTKFHETAHQWGFSSESEANFVGFLLGKESNNIELQYASYFKAMRSILNRILWVEPLYVKDYIDNKYSEGMKRDRLYELEINAHYGGSAEDAFSLMNEAFLKFNNQEGLESYGKFVELLVGFNRKYGTY